MTIYAEPLKDESLGQRRGAQPACNSGIRDRNLKEQLRLGSERTFGKIFRHNFRTGGRETSETKEEAINNSLRAMDLGALTTPETLPSPIDKGG
jgi:hypothetical protein